MEKGQGNKLVKIVVVSVLIIIIAVFGGYYAWKNRWKTYTNTEYGFEFKYPKDFLLLSDDQRFFPLITLVQSHAIKINENNIGDAFLWTFGIIADGDGKTNQEIANQAKLYEMLHLQKTAVDGRLAFHDNSSTMREGVKITTTRYWIFNNDKILAIEFRDDDIGDRIFSTLRFIK